MKADKEATLAQNYQDYRSFMRSDGSEVLYGEDWKARVEQLRVRSGGRCESQQPWKVWPLSGPGLERCSRDAQDPHHVIRRSVRRDDRLSNLQALCRYHHDLLDERKIRSDKKERANVRTS